MADADMAQVAEHILGKDEVTSSNLVISSINPAVFVTAGFLFGKIARLPETQPFRELVLRSCENPL